jgi:20S proteasome alpha/beta subunit
LQVSIKVSIYLSIILTTPCLTHFINTEKPFLGYVDLIGTSYEENFIATGFGAYLAIPIIREKWNAEMSEGDAIALMEGIYLYLSI